jgi:hypothetical protein
MFIVRIKTIVTAPLSIISAMLSGKMTAKIKVAAISSTVNQPRRFIRVDGADSASRINPGSVLNKPRLFSVPCTSKPSPNSSGKSASRVATRPSWSAKR